MRCIVSYHYYIRDYQGNNRVVVAPDGTVEQTNDYYAYGGPWGNTSTNQGFQPFKYNGRSALCDASRLKKELDRVHGLDWYDYGARLYDPAIGRFLSPDPFVQLPQNSQNFNRYSYGLNNPLKYTDENGEFWHILIGAAIGGVVNLIATWDNIDGFWQGFTAFAVGAGVGASVAATGGASIGTIVGVSTAGGVGTAATNSIIAQTGKNFQGINHLDWVAVGKSSLIGGISGVAGGTIGAYASSAPWLVNGMNSPVLRSAVASPLAAGAGQIAGGTTYGLLEGNSLSTSFDNSLDGIGTNMAIGGAIGITSTIGAYYSNGINPWNGKILNTNKGHILQQEINKIKNGGPRYHLGHDSKTFYNNSQKEGGYLPRSVQYKEYVVLPSGSHEAGTLRIVVGNDGNWYYSPNHYKRYLYLKP